MRIKQYSIGGVRLRVESEEEISDSGFFSLFRIGDENPVDVTVRVTRSPLPRFGEKELPSDRRRYRITDGGQSYGFVFFADSDHPAFTPYACEVPRGDGIDLYIDYEQPFWDGMIFDALDVGRLFLLRRGAVVHASFITAGNRGILFAGPKQIGKSTQASLWERYRGAEIINGDRAVIRNESGKWLAYGPPFCGSSSICLNEKSPLFAIAFPAKSDYNTVERLSPFDAFKRLIGCFTYPEDDVSVRDAAISFAEEIVSSVPCLLLKCRPDYGAVETLAKELCIEA